ncbi:hypothetical protein [Blastococcus mobilis]|uniref:Uncharacterized protein n=1 Tax=Blastococcus mobilis TaxID=1938746 RepID=A0A238WRY4_9ACTN|nr:hypothetical protein [Blastococcus mobilis]SNR49168.1 hypothetical protein SAMN06272737_109105 [Blastococcus mobilis]
MTAFVPQPVPLEMPPGDPAAVDELVSDVSGAGFWLAVLRDELSGPAASAPGWLGNDAVAAAGQVVRVAGLAREAAAAVLGVRGRLSAYGELLRETRRGISRLREEQEEDTRAAWARLQGLQDVTTAMRTGAPDAVAIVEEFEATEAARRRRHAALLEVLAEDAAATVRALAGASRPVGGSGRPGDEGRVLAYLAAELPGWGDEELAGRGARLARVLSGPVEDADWNALAREATAYAGSAAFAEALLLGLGVEGVRELLGVLGDGRLGADSAVAGLLAGALGGALRTGDARDPVGAVLDAVYVGVEQQDARVAVDPGPDPDVVALGMGAVLAATVGMRSGGLRPETIGTWGRQLLAREHAWDGWRSVERAVPANLRVPPVDPVPLVVGLLADSEAAEAATFLGGLHVWSAILARSWDDGGAAVADLVERAGAEQGPAGDSAVRAGLRALGAGLADGDPEDWRVDRGTAAAVAPALGRAVAGHIGVAVEALWVGVDGGSGGTSDALRGLGHLTLARDAEASVAQALYDWARTQPTAFEGTSASAPLPAVAVPAAYVAAKEYGQRLDHALDGFEAQEAAEEKEWWWDHTVGLVGFAPGAWGVGLGLVEGYLAITLDMDGTWTDPVDAGLSFDGADAASAARAGVASDSAEQARAVVDQARAAYERTADVLGRPEPPVSPRTDYLEPLGEVATDVAVDRARRGFPVPFYGPR